MRHSRGYPSWYWVNQAELAWDVRITRYTMTNTAQIQGVPAQQGGAIQSLGAGVLAVYLFCVYSRVLDPLIPSAHLPALMSLVMLIVIAFSGSVHEILQASPVRKVVFLTFWMFASLPTSYWRGGSIAAIQQQWIPAVIPMVALAGLGISLRRVMAVLRVLFVAAIFTALLARVFPNYMAGRLSGTLGNPNDLAAVLVVGLALSWFIFSSVRPLGRVALCLTTAPILLALLQTGSRGGMLALLILGVTVFARLPMSGRISMFAICCVGVLVAGITLQRSLLLRYETFFTPEDETNEQYLQDEESAVASTASRTQLLKDSIWLTIYHPVFGVGMGNFLPAAAEYQKAQGRRAMWHATHNTYTQISSELGLPGLIVYLSLIVGIWKTLGRLRKAEYNHALGPQIRSAANAIQLALLCYCVSAAFASLAYIYQLPLIVGLTVALEAAVVREGALAAGPVRLPLSQPRTARPLLAPRTAAMKI